MRFNFQRGASLFFAVMIMTILLAIALGLSAILISQIKIIRGMGDSVIAFYAADAGIEKVLVDRQSPNLTPGHYSGSLLNGATYQVFVTRRGAGGCTAPNFCIKSIGVYKEVRRAIEITY